MILLRTIQDVRDAIENHFSNRWNDVTPIFFQNVLREPKTNWHSWVALTITFQAEKIRDAAIGIVVLQIFVSKQKDGRSREIEESKLRELADKAREIFSVGEVIGKTTTIKLLEDIRNSIREESEWRQLNVTTSFNAKPLLEVEKQLL